MPILYDNKNKNATSQVSEFSNTDKQLDKGVSRQSGKTVFVGGGAEAPLSETPKKYGVTEYQKVGTKGARDYATVDDFKKNVAYHPGRKEPIDVSAYTDDDYVRDAQARLQKEHGENWKYTKVGNRYYRQQGRPTDYVKNEYSTGQFYLTDKQGNVVNKEDYPSYFDYQENLIVDQPTTGVSGIIATR